MSQTETIKAPTHTPVRTDDGDHDLFSHYAKKADILKATIEGAAIVALCGKTWVPTKDGQRFPVCPECKKIYDSLPPGE